MKFSERLEKNPVMFRTIAAISVGTIVASAMGFLWKSHVDLIEKEGALSLEVARFEHSKEIVSLRNSLESRVRSIERRIGDQRHLDILETV